MTFSQAWEQLRTANRNVSTWPWSDLVTYINRYCSPEQGFKRVLEIGCGAGANVPLFRQLAVDYYAVEGSPSAVELFHKLHPDFKDRIALTDFTEDLVFVGPFDIIVDRGSITCNGVEAASRTLRMAFERLRPGGKYLGLDWFSMDHQDARSGEPFDTHTRCNIKTGPLAGHGTVQFVDQKHLTNLIVGAGFGIERLEHKSTKVVFPVDGAKSAWWHVVAAKL